MEVTGFWTGEYAYDNGRGLVVEFHAELEQAGAILSGNTTENNTFGDQGGNILIAELFGKVSGKRIDFTKSYTNGPPGQEKILYQGTISEDGSFISGSWTMMSMWAGSFKMTRAIEQKPKARVVAEEELVS